MRTQGLGRSFMNWLLTSGERLGDDDASQDRDSYLPLLLHTELVSEARDREDWGTAEGSKTGTSAPVEENRFSSLKKDWPFAFVYVFMPEWIYVHSLCAGAYRDQRAWDLVDLELQAIVSLVWVLGTKPHFLQEPQSLVTRKHPLQPLLCLLPKGPCILHSVLSGKHTPSNFGVEVFWLQFLTLGCCPKKGKNEKEGLRNSENLETKISWFPWALL